MSGGDLFERAAAERLKERAPLAARLRPRSLDEVVGQQDLVGSMGGLRALAESGRLGSTILWGPPGTGKTTIARLLAALTGRVFVSLSATSAGVKDLREVIERARATLGEQGRSTLLFIDEVHRFNKAQQDVLLPGVEEGLVCLVGATTENPFFELNAPLMSRAMLWRLRALSAEEIAAVVARGLKAEGAEASQDAVELIAASSAGDARSALNTTEAAVALARARGGDAERVVASDVGRARDARIFHQGVTEHYDQVSALIKSIRGSDPDAGLYWMARMLQAGEDPRFLARRLVILASEDVGLADPFALVLAAAAAQAVELVGLPEAALNLAECVVYLAAAPKSNRVTSALSRAGEDVQGSVRGEVPDHLRDSHSPNAARRLGTTAYRYPHDDASGWVDQPYRPQELEGHLYYEPSVHGREPELAEWLARRRRPEMTTPDD
ncbi:MAG: replication-associated recombination protein A [Acidimicrobiales bacterium]